MPGPATLAPLLLAALLQAQPPAASADEPFVIPEADVVCDLGENDPRLPSASSSRTELYDLFLGQRLRAAQQRELLEVLRARFPGEATEAFAAMAQSLPPDSDASIALFESIIQRHAGSSDPELQVEVARARWNLILAWRSRHTGESDSWDHLFVAETYQGSGPGRRWSELLDAFLRDYRGRGAMFDEFVARAEYEVIVRSAADRTPGEHLLDPRYVEPEVAAIGADMRAQLLRLIDRYGDSPDERVQRTVADARDIARRDLGPEAAIPYAREVIARYRLSGDHDLRARVSGAYSRLQWMLEEAGQASQAAAVSAEAAAWEAARNDIDCGPEAR